MRLQRITNTQDKEFKETWKVYEEAFPEDERRTIETQEKVMNTQEYSFNAIIQDEKIIGLLATWNFQNFIFVEHLAIHKDLRNKNFGAEILQDFFNAQKEALIVGETERPEEGELAKRRIDFYKRLGGALNLYDYIQPAYGPEKEPVPLYLITFPRSITEEEFETIRKTLHTRVYGLREPLLKIS